MATFVGMRGRCACPITSCISEFDKAAGSLSLRLDLMPIENSEPPPERREYMKVVENYSNSQFFRTLLSRGEVAKSSQYLADQ